jgi:hypothetical protein
MQEATQGIFTQSKEDKKQRALSLNSLRSLPFFAAVVCVLTNDKTEGVGFVCGDTNEGAKMQSSQRTGTWRSLLFYFFALRETLKNYNPSSFKKPSL